MNYRGIYRNVPLSLCRKCGMDSGVRKVTDTAIEQYFVECESCGFKTKYHKSQGAASKEWNGGKNERLL